MISNEGKIYIKRYLAGWTPSIASSIAFGVGGKAENANDRKLQFEVGRADISIASYDFATDKLIFKAPLPEDLTGVIYEVGLFSQESNSLSGDYGSEMITTFDSDEEWYDAATAAVGTYSTANTRIGDDSLRLAPATGTTVAVRMDDIALDFSGNTNADKFFLAFNATANASNIGLRFMTDSTNYYSFSFTPSTGYNVLGAAISTATATGTPSWDEINSIEVSATAAGGASTIDLDGLRIEDLDTPNPEYVMVSRELLSTPFVKEGGRLQAIEFALDVAV